MVSLFSIGFLKLYFRHEIPPYTIYSFFTSSPLSFSFHYPIPSLCCLVDIKTKKLKKNNFYWSLYSFLFGSLSYLKITLGIAMHCQHCNIIAIEHHTPQSTFCTQRTNIPAFIPPFLRNHIILSVFKLLFTYPNCSTLCEHAIGSMPIYQCDVT